MKSIQEGRFWDEAAIEYVKAACRIGLDKEQILHRLYTLGYDQKKTAVKDIANQINSETQWRDVRQEGLDKPQKKDGRPELFALPGRRPGARRMILLVHLRYNL